MLVSRKGRTAALAAFIALALAPAAALADNSSTLTVVGTSDVYDSNLVQQVLKPGFEAAYPQYTLNYVSKGTDAAIAYAKAGTASAMIVHAASLENQFVDQGYSNEKYGRAIFWGDYVLLGPADDPAGVMANGSHDIVTAFEDIAAAGAAGHATFVSRGDAPGTTVQEHAIWALANPDSPTRCTVGASLGGGQSPSTTAGDCPAGGITYPSWYGVTHATQAPNILAGDSCPPATYPNGGCYVFTDRGTYQYLVSTGAIHNLHIVTRDNSPTARGTNTLLVNSFHAYAINPAKFAGTPAVQINVPAATAFLDWVTSPPAQAAVGAFLSSELDPPFLPDAAPKLTASAIPATVSASTPLTVTGRVSNVVPGTPPLAGQVVTLSALPSWIAALNPVAVPAPVATATTDASGNYTIGFTPTASATYTVSTGQLSQVENASLTPVFGDLLAPTSKSVGKSDVQSGIGFVSVNPAYRQAVVTGFVAPGTGHSNASVSIGVRSGPSGAFATKATAPLADGTSSFAVPVPLAPGTYEAQATYADPGVTLPSTSSVVSFTVPGSAAVKITKATVKAGVLSLKGSLSPTPTARGGWVDLLARHVKPIKKGKPPKKTHSRATAAKTAPLAKVARKTIASRQTTFSYRVRLRHGYQWQLQLKYMHPGTIDPSYSRLRSINVR